MTLESVMIRDMSLSHKSVTPRIIQELSTNFSTATNNAFVIVLNQLLEYSSKCETKYNISI